MTGRPQANEYAPDYFKYISLVPSEDAPAVMASQLDESLAIFSGISEEKSRHRYAPGKWSIREVLNHISDNERAFIFRALWFARGFSAPLLGFDQDVASAGAQADSIPWAAHVEEFRRVRLSTISLFANLPEGAWSRSGIANNNPVTVRALAFIIPGHVTHHINILREHYL